MFPPQASGGRRRRDAAVQRMWCPCVCTRKWRWYFIALCIRLVGVSITKPINTCPYWEKHFHLHTAACNVNNAWSVCWCLALAINITVGLWNTQMPMCWSMHQETSSFWCVDSSCTDDFGYASDTYTRIWAIEIESKAPSVRCYRINFALILCVTMGLFVM